MSFFCDAWILFAFFSTIRRVRSRVCAHSTQLIFIEHDHSRVTFSQQCITDKICKFNERQGTSSNTTRCCRFARDSRCSQFCHMHDRQVGWSCCAICCGYRLSHSILVWAITGRSTLVTVLVQECGHLAHIVSGPQTVVGADGSNRTLPYGLRHTIQVEFLSQCCG